MIAYLAIIYIQNDQIAMIISICIKIEPFRSCTPQQAIKDRFSRNSHLRTILTHHTTGVRMHDDDDDTHLIDNYMTHDMMTQR